MFSMQQGLKLGQMQGSGAPTGPDWPSWKLFSGLVLASPEKEFLKSWKFWLDMNSQNENIFNQNTGPLICSLTHRERHHQQCWWSLEILQSMPGQQPQVWHLDLQQQEPSFYAFNSRTANVDFCSAMGFVVRPIIAWIIIVLSEMRRLIQNSSHIRPYRLPVIKVWSSTAERVKTGLRTIGTARNWSRIIGRSCIWCGWKCLANFNCLKK